ITILPIPYVIPIRQNSMPPPSTLTIYYGQRLSKTELGMQVRLYSNYPWRKEGGPKDGFERKALDVLTEKAKEGELTFYEFTDIDGRPFLRYAKGQLMKQSCVKCHNSDKTSPRRGWREGDLVGVLAITRPLDRDIARTQSGLQLAFLVTGIIALVFVGSCLGFLVRARMKSVVRA